MDLTVHIDFSMFSIFYYFLRQHLCNINRQLNHQEVRFNLKCPMVPFFLCGLFSAHKKTCVTMLKMAEILFKLFGSLHRDRYSHKIHSPGGRDLIRLLMFMCLITWFQLRFQNHHLRSAIRTGLKSRNLTLDAAIKQCFRIKEYY